MKQTNNAIKFLMAQYRAIFKNAYFKGLTSALVLTAGLTAAGTANASVPSTGFTGYEAASAQSWGDSASAAVDAGNVSKDIYLDEDAYITNGTFTGDIALDKLTNTGNSGGTLYVAGTITIDKGSLNFKGGGENDALSIAGSNGTNDGLQLGYGSLILQNNSEANLTQTIVNIGSVTVDGSTVNVGGATVNNQHVGGNINLSTYTGTGLQGVSANANTYSANSALGATFSGASGGSMLITNGSTININDGGSVYGRDVTVMGSEVNFNGTGPVTGASSAVMFATVGVHDGTNQQNGSLNISNSTINVAENAYGGIFGDHGQSSASYDATKVNSISVNLGQDTTVNVDAGGTLQMGMLLNRNGAVYAATPSSSQGNTHIVAAPEFNLNNNAQVSNAGTVEFIATGNKIGETNAFKTAVDTVQINLNDTSSIANTSEESKIIIGTGNQVNLLGGSIDNAVGVLDIQEGAELAAAEQKSLQTDGVVNLAGNINVGGELSIAAGTTVAFAKDANISANSTVAAAGDGSASFKPATGVISLEGSKDAGTNVVTTANAQMSAATLDGFLSKGGVPVAGSTDKAGTLFLNYGLVDFGEDKVTLSDFGFKESAGDSASDITAADAGNIVVGTSGATLKADTFRFESALHNDGTATAFDPSDNALYLEANNVEIEAATLTAVSQINTATGNLGFTDAIVHNNLNVNYTGNTNLQLGNTYNLQAYTTNADNSLSPAAGTITGRDFTVGKDGSLNVQAGNWTAESQITLKAINGSTSSGGAITVTTEFDDDHQATNDKALLTSSSLTLNKGLVFNVDAGSNSNKQSPTVTVSVSEESEARGLTAHLDLTAGVSVVKSATADNNTSGSITVSGNGASVLMAGADINKILGSSTDTSTKNLTYLALLATADGVLEANSEVSANYGDFDSGSIAAQNKINLSDSGTFKAPTLTLTGTAATDNSNKLDVGTGSIEVQTLNLQESTNNLTNSKITLAGGNINVSSALNAQTDILSVSGANVNLASANGATAGTLGINDLEIVGGLFNVEQGLWKASTADVNISATGKLTVGKIVGDEGAEFGANRLTIGAMTNAGDAAVEVNDLGNATFTSADLSAATQGAVVVHGQMTITGAAIDMDGDADNDDNNQHGLYFGNNNNTGLFNVDGGKLTFGTEATKAFYNTALQDSGTAIPGDTANTKYPYVAENAQDKLIVSNGGEVELSLSADVSFNKAQIQNLKEQLFADINQGYGSEKLDGFLNIGDASIDGIVVTSGSISWNDLDPYTDIIWDATNTELSSAKVTDVVSTSQIGGIYGSLEAVNGTETVTIASNTKLSNAAGNQNNFIGTAEGKTIGAEVASEQILTLEGAGNVGKITLQAGSDNDETGVEFDATASGDAITVQGAITGPVDGNTYTLFKGEGTTTVQGNITVGSVGVAGNLVAQGDITSDEMWVDGSLTAEKSVTTNGIDAKNGATVSVAGDMTLGSRSTQGHAYADIEDSSKIAVAGDLTVYGGTIRVGSDDITHTQYVNATQPDGSNPYNGYVDAADETADGQISNTASTGYLEVLGETRLNGATVFVDPTYGLGTSLATFATFADSSINHGQLGVLDGNIVVGKNAAVGLGLTNAELAERIAQFQTNGSLNEGLYGSILYVNGQVNVADGQYIAINGNANNKTVEQINADFGNNTADLRLGSNTALIISDNAVQAAANSRDNNRDAAIEFNKAGATVYAQTDAAVLLDGTTFSLNELKLFDDADGNGVTLTSEDGQGLYVGTVSGLFEAWMDDGEAGTIKLSITRNGLENTVLSYPVKDSLYAILDDTVKTETVPPTEDTPPAEGEGSEGGDIAGDAGSEGDVPAETSRVITEVNKYKLDQGSFLATALAEQASLQSVEQAARLGVYAGVAQATLGATNTTTEAISGRMGVGAQSGTITYADNGQGAGLWLSPVYKNHSSDGFDAEGADYGVDMDLYGLALGADYTLANGVRIGAMFNVGSGDADGNGVASGVSNDFDYYGFGVYGGYTMGALSVVADVTYTAVDNDFDSSTGLTNYSKLEGSADSDALSIGVTGQYEFATQSMTVTPHAGLRFTKVSMDDYTVKAGGTNIADFEADDMNVFSIPVGVTFASEFTSGDWSVQPSLDVTLTANAGDTDLDGDSRWLGTDNGFGEMTYGVSTEVLDDFTYGATLGIAAKTGGFSLGLGVNYTGSSNVDEFGVQANARFVF